MADDLISRKAAIEAVCFASCSHKPCYAPSSYCRYALAIYNLPSVESEIKAAYEQGRIQGHVEMRTELLMQLKEIVGDEVWKNI